MSTGEFKVVFKGGILPGFEPELVRQKAGRRLKASEEQIGKMFSGRTAVLRKGVELEMAERYVRELRAIGMDVAYEAMTPPAAPPQPAAPVQAADLEKTQLADPNALAAYLNESMMPDHGEAPDSLIGRRKSAEQAPSPESAASEQVRTLVASADALNRYLDSTSEFTPPEAAPEPGLPAASLSPAERLALAPEAPAPAPAPTALSQPFSRMHEAAADLVDDALMAPSETVGLSPKRKQMYFLAGAVITLLIVLWLI